MVKTINNGQLATLLRELSLQPEIKENANVIMLTSNELADVLLKVSSGIRKELLIDELLENTVRILGESGIAERVLIFQINNDGTKSLLTQHWESSYVPKFNPVGFQLDLRDVPLFKLFDLTRSRTLQIEDFSRYLALPNYLFRNKFKALFIKLKTRSLLVTTGSTDKIKVAISIQFCSNRSNQCPLGKTIDNIIIERANKHQHINKHVHCKHPVCYCKFF